MNFCVYGASSDEIPRRYIEAGERLGVCLAERGCGLVFGGGTTGLMGAVARGMDSVGGVDIVGIAPSFFQVDGVLYEHCTELIRTGTMRERKQLMEERADGFIVTPGGMGTMDEFFETLTLRQLGRHGKPLAILNTGGYYDELDALLRRMVAENFMKERNRALAPMFAEPEALVDWITGETVQTENVKDLKYLK